MDYNLSIKKINEINLVSYYNFCIKSEHGTFINFFFKIPNENNFIIDVDNKLVNELVKFKNELADDMSCKFIFYDADNLLRFIAYNNTNRLFCVGMLVEDLSFDVNIAISDTTRIFFCEEINQFLNNKR